MSPLDLREWLETDGLGGFAMGTVSGVRTRRYHAVLLAASQPPGGRLVLVNGLEVWLESGSASRALCSHMYGNDVIHPDGASRIARFEHEPWPRWTYRLEDGAEIVEELFVAHGEPVTVITWKGTAGTLRVRPLLSGRDMHALHHENDAFRFDASESDGVVAWRPYDDVPEIVAAHDGSYMHGPMWFRNFTYAEERARGLEFHEDLGSPGILSWDLARGPATLVLAAGREALAQASELRARERTRRSSFAAPLLRAADAYLVARGKGKTIIAGYPWFGDWGRDTFIALRGLSLASGHLEEAREILLAWAPTVSEGMLPNRFAETATAPEYNSVDASLWYVLAVFEYLRAAGKTCPPSSRKSLWRAVRAILDGYVRGTRFGIRLDTDGLIAAGESGVALTWMDARVGDQPVTPRVGKPVEVQALWLNALSAVIEAGGPEAVERWEEMFERGVDSFRRRFWNEERSSLYDVIDVDHVPGKVDPAIRPNQIFAAGGLPLTILDTAHARRVVDLAFEKLWTPMGPRSLAPGEPGYCAHDEGGVPDRDGCYHQGTVWPWLAGAFVEAWLVSRGRTAQAKAEARERFLTPLAAHGSEAGLGHLSEIADAEPPHVPRGCPFQAWSMGELIRMAAMLDVPLAALLADRDVPRRLAAASGDAQGTNSIR